MPREKEMKNAGERQDRVPDAQGALQSVYSGSMVDILQELRSTLLISAYQSGYLIAVRIEEGRLNTHFRLFQVPMGLAVGARDLAIGTRGHVWTYRDHPEAGAKVSPPGNHDGCFLPKTCHVTGNISIHEMAFAGGELWVVNTRFSCLATLDSLHSFVPRWHPPFISRLSSEDRCHLNGIAVAGEQVRYATAFGATDTPQGWRDRKASGGILIDVASGEIVAEGLSMPHSPRWYDDRLWVLESGKGRVATVDLDNGQVETVADLPGFTRGLAFAGPYAFVGLSQVRESNMFGGIPLTERVAERLCGVWVLDIRTGRTVGCLRFEGIVQEIFDLQFLYGKSFPEIAALDTDLVADSFIVPVEAMKQFHRRREAPPLQHEELTQPPERRAIFWRRRPVSAEIGTMSRDAEAPSADIAAM